MKIDMKKTLVIIFIVSLVSLLGSKIKADVVADYGLNITVNDDYSSKIDVTIPLENNSDSALINAYSVDFPFLITNASATLNGNPVNVLLTSDSTISSVKVDFETNVIKPNQNAILVLSLFSVDTIKQVLNTKQLYLPFPTSNYPYTSVNISVSYPVLFGSISYSSQSKYTLDRLDDNYSKATFNQPSSVFLIWGNPEFDLVFNSNLTNRKDSTNHSLFNLIPEYENQAVEYKKIFNADYALTDKLNNNFAFITINPNSTLDLSSSATIKLSNSDKFLNQASKYNWQLNLDSVLGQKIYSKISQGSDNTSKFTSLNDFLFQNFAYNSDSLVNQNFNSIWDSNKRNLNPLEYCYLIIATAEYLNLKANVEYGYNIFSSTESINPSVWCTVQVDNRNLIFDFYSQKQAGYAQIPNSSIDRVKMGIWHPSQSYNDILGLLSNNPLTASVTAASSIGSAAQLIPILETEFPESVFSGEFYAGLIHVTNPTTKILKFNQLNINGESVLSNIQVGELDKAVMPLQKNTIKIDYLRETDFILNLSREINVEAELNDNKISNTLQVRFEPDYKLLALFIVILIVTLSIFTYLLLKVIKRKV